MTYLQILNLIKDTALAQPNVNTVVREFIDLNREDTVYSAVVIQDRDGTRDRIIENDYITYTWHLGYVDRLTYDESNRDDIFSTGINVINNIVNSIRNTYFPTLEVRVIDRFNTFNQRFTASCAGVYVVLAIDVQVSDCVDGEMTDMYDSFEAKLTENGHYHFIPDGRPVDEIDITVDVDAPKPEESLVETITTNGVHNFWPSTGSVFKDAKITVEVPEKEELVLKDEIWWSEYAQTYTFDPPAGKVYKSVEISFYPGTAAKLSGDITENGTYVYTPVQGDDYYTEVSLNVDVHPSSALSLSCYQNGTYTISDEFNGGTIEVSVEGNCPLAEPGAVYITENGFQTIYPDHPESETFSCIEITTDVHPSQSLVETITSNGTVNFSGEWKDAAITVAVSQAKPEETLSETITSNGSYSYSPTPGSVFSSVALSVDVHPSTSLVETITSNGTTSFSGEWTNATISVDVHPSNTLSRTYTTNGSKTITGEFNGGTINVNVHPSASLSARYTANGTYAVTGEFNGGTVEVSVTSLDPVPASNEIYYRSYTAGQTVVPYNSTDFGANLVSNTVVSGDLCLLTFDGPVTRTGINSFYQKTGLKEIFLPNGVVTISQNSFGETGLQRIVMPNTVVDIQGFAFVDCFALITHLKISENCAHIGGYSSGSSAGASFEGCTALTMITIPASVTDISAAAFKDCIHLLGVKVFATTPPNLDLSASNTYNQFENNAPNRKIMVPAASLNVYKTAPGWSDYAADIISL